jgi:hypothetical protein
LKIEWFQNQPKKYIPQKFVNYVLNFCSWPKVHRNKPSLHSLIFFKIQWLGTSKYTMFLIILKLQKNWNLINVLFKMFLWKYLFKYFILNDFSKFNGSNKIKVHNVVSDTTQGRVYLSTYVTNVVNLNVCIIICS